jgi:hypothetical protein
VVETSQIALLSTGLLRMTLLRIMASLRRPPRIVGRAGVRVDAARDPPELVQPVIKPWLEDPLPDYDNEPVFPEN